MKRKTIIMITVIALGIAGCTGEGGSSGKAVDEEVTTVWDNTAKNDDGTANEAGSDVDKAYETEVDADAFSGGTKGSGGEAFDIAGEEYDPGDVIAGAAGGGTQSDQGISGLDRRESMLSQLKEGKAGKKDGRSASAGADLPDRKAMKEAYTEAINTFFKEHKLPCGRDLSEALEDRDDFDENMFAVYDFDGDGIEELDIKVTAAAYSGSMIECIYGYDTESGELYEELADYPDMNYFDYGCVQVFDSHNQGLSGSFWPFTFFRYDRDTKVFEPIVYIEGWDGNEYPKDHKGNKFPSEYDKDKDGIIYYVKDGRIPHKLLRDEPCDYGQVVSWVYDNVCYEFLAADKVTPQFKAFDQKEISAYEKSGPVKTQVDPDEYTRFVLRDMTFWLPNDFVDKVTVMENDNGYSFYHTASMEAGKKLYPDEPYPEGYLFAITVDRNDTEFDMDIGYHYYGSCYSGYDGKLYHYTAATPSDFPAAGDEASIAEYQSLQKQYVDIHEDITDGFRLEKMPWAQ